MQTKLYFEDTVTLYTLKASLGENRVGYVNYQHEDIEAMCIFKPGIHTFKTINQAKNWIATCTKTFFRECKMVEDSHTLEVWKKINPKYWGRRGRTIHVPCSFSPNVEE